MSTKTIAQKLQIKVHTQIWLSHVEHFAQIEPLPEHVGQAECFEQATTVLFFAESAAALRDLLSQHKPNLHRPSNFWVAYPKANRIDINRDSLWPILAEYGMRPISQIAIDSVWSALRFRPIQEGEKPFLGNAKAT